MPRAIAVRIAALVLVVLPALAVAGRPARAPVRRAARSAPPRWQRLPMPPPMPPAAAHGEVAVGGARIYYASYGHGDPVILLHGGMGNSDHWANQVVALAAKLRVIVIDSRGQGRSTRTRAPASYELMAGDVLAVMDHLKLARAALVGWSDGGEIALALAIAHPERVSRLFVIGVNYDAHGSKPRGGRPSATFTAYVAKCRADYRRLSPTPAGFRGMIDWLLPVWRDPRGFTRDQLRAIQAPTVIADGDHDEIIVLDQEREMAQLIPHGQLVVFPDTSHFAIWQDPDAVDRALLAFLVPPPAPPAVP